MGAWGPNTFQNDTACDWLYELEESEDLSLVHVTIDRVLEVGDRYLDSDLASEALAACEVIAQLKGHEGGDGSTTQEIKTWIKNHPRLPSQDLVDAALAAIDRILNPPSELVELWEEGDGGQDWKRIVKGLRLRVEHAARGAAEK